MTPLSIIQLVATIIGPIISGVLIWALGRWVITRSQQNDAIRDLMTYRGDIGSTDFQRSLNKVSITFHKDDVIRKEIRLLYELVNSPQPNDELIKRKIVELIYNLCQKNGYKGITEYDIDQSFPETRQSPEAVPLSPTDQHIALRKPDADIASVVMEEVERATST